MTPASSTPPTLGIRFLGLGLQSDVRGVHVSHFLIASFVAIMLASFLPQMQAYLLTEFLQLPEARHGRVSGMLNFWQEIVIICAVALVGPLSDKVGRKPLMSGGFLIMAVGLALQPLATTVMELLAYRCIFAVGIAAVTVMMVTLLADYIANPSRGKAAGFQGMMNGLGAVVAVFLLLRLPAIFQAQGMSPVEAGRLTYQIAAAAAAFTGILMALGLKGGRPRAAVDTPQSFRELAQAGFVSAARDPRIALAYGASFVARGNLAIVGTFMVLWAANYGTSVLGLTRAEALAKAGMLVGIAQGTALLAAPIFGILSDRIDRVKALGIALFVSGIGYGSTYFVTDPFGGFMIVCAIMIGLGEVGCIITSGVLISQQSPERNRGAVIGTFNLSGAIGILVASVAGGWLFDHWRESGPFVLYGILALLIMGFAAALAQQENGTQRVMPVESA
jgi:MFS family permease